MTTKEKIDAFFDAVDAIVLRLRVYIKSLFGVLLLVQGVLLIPAVEASIPPKYAKIVGILNALVGYFTLRSEKQAKSLAEVERVGGPAAMARVPTPMGVPTTELPTPKSMPIQPPRRLP